MNYFCLVVFRTLCVAWHVSSGYEREYAFVLFFFFSSNRDVPGGPTVKNPPCSSGDSGSVPGRGTKVPYAKEQLSPRATARESTPLNKRAEGHTKTQRSQVNK